MYDLKRVAAELFLAAEDLQEIYEDFFTEADGLVNSAQTQLAKGDYENLRRTLHAVKGMAVNLRMERLSLLARQAEQEALRQDNTLLKGLLGEIMRELDELRGQINNFYHG